MNASIMAQDGEPDGNFVYFFHPDHLASTSYVTDSEGQIFEHVLYFPFGETWVEESSNTERTPYLFTSKELDEDTLLYYFGARYYDPRTSVWQSPDPLLAQYLNGRPNGGVYAPMNLGLFSYANNSPLLYVDPDGEFARVSVKGNEVTITIPIQFRNRSNMSTARYEAKIREWTAAIASTWSGKFGKYQVRTSVQRLSEGEAREIGVQGGGLNVMDVTEAPAVGGADQGHATIWTAKAVKKNDDGKVVSNFNTKGASEEGQGDLVGDADGNTAAHEAGHLLGLSHEGAGNRKIVRGPDGRLKDQYDPTNIMTAPAKGGRGVQRPSAAQIEYIKDQYCNNGCRP